MQKWTIRGAKYDKDSQTEVDLSSVLPYQFDWINWSGPLK